MSDRLRVGFLGAGLIATIHSKSLRHCGAPIERVGVYDADAERSAAFAAASGHVAMHSEDEVLDTCDAVYICTWTSEHARQVDKAARRGLAVFCEKPLAFDLATAASMAASVAAAGVVNQVGLVLRHSPAYLWARHLIEEPDAGQLMAVVFRDDQFIPIQGHYGSTWRSDRTRAGAGTLLEHSIHDVDMLRFLVGDVERVSTFSTNFHGHDGIEDVATASIRFATGALGTLTSIWHDNLARPSLRHVEIFCERRLITIEGDDWYGPVHWSDSRGPVHSLTGDDLAAAVAPLRDGPDNPDGAFVSAALAGTPAHPNFADAVEAHRVVEAMYASARRDGQSVAVGRG
ncbi:MAG TPA: Gfo/Idh/MocA family oxidoreductase [Ilumatobacteraceae bacterium]